MHIIHKNFNGTIYRLGAAALVVGFALETAFSYIHPHEQDPNNFPAVFAEYAASAHWVAIHMGELLGVLLFLIFGMTVVYLSLIEEEGMVALLARLGMALAVVTFAVFVVLQAIDGLALKKMVDSWSVAPAGELAAAVRIAEAVRWVEISLDSLYRAMNGSAVLLFGAAMIASDGYSRWIGWLGGVFGAGEIAVSITMGLTGPSTLVVYGNLVPLTIGAIWLIAVATTLWRRSGF